MFVLRGSHHEHRFALFIPDLVRIKHKGFEDMIEMLSVLHKDSMKEGSDHTSDRVLSSR